MDTFVTTEPFRGIFLLRKKTSWYSVCDGNWTDPHTWMSNKDNRKTITYPQDGDDVYIYHNVVCDRAVNSTTTLNNLTVTGKLSYGNTAVTIVVNGEFYCTGTLDQSSNTGAIMVLRGYNTIIANYLSNSSSTISYASFYGYTQLVYPMTYQNLNLYSYKTDLSMSAPLNTNNTKYLSTDLIVNGNLALGCILDSKGFNITVNGQTSTAWGTSSILSSTSILFVGLVQDNGGAPLTITGGANVECRGGITIGDQAFFTATTSNVNFTTNNQTITINGGAGNVYAYSATITGAITLTVATGNSNPFIINTVINGTASGSTLTNNGIIQFNSASSQMTTGVFNYMNNAGSTVIYNNTGNYTLPYTTYASLTVQGSGIRTFSGNPTINANLRVDGLGISNSCYLDLGSNNLTVTGTTTTANLGYLQKTGAGTLLFVGQFGTSGGGNFDFSGGNPTIEFRGGMQLINSGSTILWGTGNVSFTTNNQIITQVGAGTIGGNVTIGSGVTVTTNNNFDLAISGVLNGTDSTSILINGLNSTINYQNATAPMAIGKLYCNQASNTFDYGLAGNQDITVPTDPTSPGYYNLILNGSGAKRLLGNVSVKGIYSLAPPATLNTNGFSLTNP